MVLRGEGRNPCVKIVPKKIENYSRDFKLVSIFKSASFLFLLLLFQVKLENPTRFQDTRFGVKRNGGQLCGLRMARGGSDTFLKCKTFRPRVRKGGNIVLALGLRRRRRRRRRLLIAGTSFVYREFKILFPDEGAKERKFLSPQTSLCHLHPPREHTSCIIRHALLGIPKSDLDPAEIVLYLSTNLERKPVHIDAGKKGKKPSRWLDEFDDMKRRKGRGVWLIQAKL